MIKRLLIDTSYKNLTIIIVEDNKILAQINEVQWQKQSEFLASFLQGMLQKYQLKIADFAEIYVGYGPGSFTGVRIAMTFAKVLAYATGAKLYSFPSLALLGKSENFISAYDMKNNRYFGAIFQKGLLVETEKVFSLEELEEESFKRKIPLILANDDFAINLSLIINNSREENVLKARPNYL